jgi:hypothetical protein
MIACFGLSSKEERNCCTLEENPELARRAMISSGLFSVTTTK